MRPRPRDEARFAFAGDDGSGPRADSYGMPQTTTTPWRLGPSARRAAITFHIVSSVGLLGTTAGTLLLALTAAATDDVAFAEAIYRLMASFTVAFGIPLSFLSLASGVLVGLGTKWGVFRYWWTTVKLLLIVGVIVNGAANIGPTVDALRSDPMVGADQARVAIAAALSVAMLITATGLSVFRRPAGRIRRADRYDAGTRASSSVDRAQPSGG